MKRLIFDGTIAWSGTVPCDRIYRSLWQNFIIVSDFARRQFLDGFPVAIPRTSPAGDSHIFFAFFTYRECCSNLLLIASMRLEYQTRVRRPQKKGSKIDKIFNEYENRATIEFAVNVNYKNAYFHRPKKAILCGWNFRKKKKQKINFHPVREKTSNFNATVALVLFIQRDRTKVFPAELSFSARRWGRVFTLSLRFFPAASRYKVN